MDANTIAVIGYGTIGESFAQLYAEHGYTVKVTDIREDIDELIATTNARLGEDSPPLPRRTLWPRPSRARFSCRRTVQNA